MFNDEAREIVEFALAGPLLQPSIEGEACSSFGIRTSDLAEAFRLYGLPIRNPAESRILRLHYLPDAVASEQGKLTEYGTNTELFSVALKMKEQISKAITHRIGHSHPSLDNEIDGALCAILEGRLARGKTIPLFEDLFAAYMCGYWPFSIQMVEGRSVLSVFNGGVPLDRGVYPS